MAYVQFTNPNVQAYHNNDYMDDDYRVTEISDEGVAQVRAEVAENLVAAGVAEHYDTEAN